LSYKLVKLDYVIIIKVLCYYNIYLFGFILAIIAKGFSILICNVFIRIEEVVDVTVVVKLRPIFNVAIMIEFEAIIIVIFIVMILT